MISGRAAPRAADLGVSSGVGAPRVLPPGGSTVGMSTRKELHARVSTEAHDAFHAFADEEGCTVTSLLEEFAATLDGECAKSLAAAARRTAAARRRRPSNGTKPSRV